ncbi:hypothetical protein M378DRAFT_313726 [Amanita muscaria Koide BX008]|uniref:FAD-binding PCMH-type domain-containing protein n=1 Tax=Amanita muscaria (strain Koide BX008) TaxID=946122 RepID=A0A0C2S762_AMAMK|nr:hypothetical protein M378DRAFT_313726 [Amanita muscaria Koide BX008]
MMLQLTMHLHVYKRVDLTAFVRLTCAQTTCKCLSFQPCWPSASDFSDLASILSQPLIRPSPPASACYPPSHPSGNCTDVLSRLDDGPWRDNLPGAMQSINFESFTFDNGTIDACYYNTTQGYSCDQGNIPIIGVDARTVADIQAGLSFAAKHNLKLVIKNTGHDYLGRSMARGGFMLWTHNLKNITYNEHFVQEGAPPNSQTYQALTLGAGVQWREAYTAANHYGRVVVGGISSGGSVGAAGGWILGGGHSMLSPRYGLGVDNVLQFILVLASGEYVTANAYQHEDLFWALRGGGGGTFGVVVSVTYSTHDKLPFTSISLSVNFSTAAIAQNVTTEYFAMLPELSNAGWGGYASMSPAGLMALNFASNDSVAQGNATISSFLARVQAAIPNPGDFGVLPQSFPSFYDAYLAFFNTTGQVGGTNELFTRLLSLEIAKDQPEKVAKAALGVSTGVSFNFVAGGAVSRVDPDSAGLNPAWRKAVGLLNSGISWNEGTPTAEIDRLRKQAASDLEVLDTVSPNSGTYFNEASLYEKDFKTTFFGSHYAQLKSIKHKYDNDDLFLVAEGVGSDDWNKSLTCRL